MINKEEVEFLGRLVWEGCLDWARDNESAKGEWFRLWDELTSDEQTRYKLIGSSLITYFRAMESNETLKEKLKEAEERFEQLRKTTLKEWKERGGI